LIGYTLDWSFSLLLFNDNLTFNYLIAVLIAVLLGMTVHEFAHNLGAFFMGDDSPERRRRLTLDPSVHIYWPGFIMFVLIGFGILGTAPMDARRFRNPRIGTLVATAAGPVSNLLIAIVFGIILRIIGFPDLYVTTPEVIRITLVVMVRFNILMFVFNLLPLFPLDGWHIVYTLLPPELAYSWRDNAQMTQYIFLALILFSFVPIGHFDPLGIILRDPIFRLENLIVGFPLFA
jgi:Zn-dependent protease